VADTSLEGTIINLALSENVLTLFMPSAFPFKSISVLYACQQHGTHMLHIFVDANAVQRGHSVININIPYNKFHVKAHD
jgi:hypothetical protein